MVTSNKHTDKKVVKMSEHNSAAVVPQRTLLGEVNEHITCPLCRGYYIDATTIVECLHSFCRSCIIKHLNVKSYCPVCEMMINSAKPNIKLDKALQDIVYKLVPGLFQKEMERRQQFYSSRPGPAASATPEQRGEDTERIIFSPEDVISFSLEYADMTDTDSISSKSSDSNDPQPASATARRYLQCPAVVNINHLKKFISMKFDIDSTQFAIDILYKRVPLPDYYTLMDIAYIYNWKRNEPMRFFYQITDYVAIRNRLFEINRKGSSSCNFQDRKSSPASTEDTNASSPAPHLNDQGSEASSGTDSPMLDDNVKQVNDVLRKNDKLNEPQNKDIVEKVNNASMSPKKNDEDVEKSQFLNSFELTPKSCIPVKSSPVKTSPVKTSPVKPTNEESTIVQSNESSSKSQINPLKLEDKILEPFKRKHQATTHAPELKKLKIELEKAKITNFMSSPSVSTPVSSNQNNKVPDISIKSKENEGTSTISQTPATASTSVPIKDNKLISTSKHPESPGVKRTVSGPPNISSPKRKPPTDATPSPIPSGAQKTISPLKLQMPKTDTQSANTQSPNLKPEVQKAPVKKMPDLKPGIPVSQTSQNKGQMVNKVRMDLLANNSDPTIDRSKILSQVKSSLGAPNAVTQPSGDPLKSLFDSCKINIPSSLSITLTDQKLDPRNPGEVINSDAKKAMVNNKNLTGVSNTTHKVPSPPVHNYIEILKLPDNEPKKQKCEGNSDTKSNPPNKSESSSVQSKPPGKSSETSAKGPVPNLKPISDTKLGKQAGNFATPITFQQTFEQQLQSLQTDKKSKLPKNKAQVPKLVPATPKSLNAANKPNTPVNKPNTGNMPSIENKTGTALDLSTPHNVQNQLGQQQTYIKAFETMQSIDNLAKKQNLPTKGMSPNIPPTMTPNNVFPSSIANRPLATGISPLRIPSTSSVNPMKPDKMPAGGSQINNNRQDVSSNKNNPAKPTNNGNSTASSPAYQIASQMSLSTAQPSPRSQTRSPSSSPKLVIAEEKQTNNITPEQNINQSNQITSTQIPKVNSPNIDMPKPAPGPSKPGLKPLPSAGKLSGIRQPITPTLKANPTMNSPTDYIMSQARPQLMSHHHVSLLRQMEMSAWLKSRQFDLFKNMSNIAHQTQNDFNNKDK